MIVPELVELSGPSLGQELAAPTSNLPQAVCFRGRFGVRWGCFGGVGIALAVFWDGMTIRWGWNGDGMIVLRMRGGWRDYFENWMRMESRFKGVAPLHGCLNQEC